MPDGVVEVQGHVVGKPKPLLQLLAIHRAAADGREIVRGAVKVDVARYDARVVERKRVPCALVDRVARVGRDNYRDRRGRRKCLAPGDGLAQIFAADLDELVRLGVVAVGARLHADIEGDRLLVHPRRVRALVGTVEAVCRPEKPREFRLG